MSERQILLLHLFSGPFEIKGNIKIQLLIFMTQAFLKIENIESDLNYEFNRWDFGPHSKELEKDIEQLITINK